MKAIERIKMVKAMEYIVRQVNDEDVFFGWLWAGVADGDIEYGDLSTSYHDAEELPDYYEDDKDFAQLMDLFLAVMKRAAASGGLYCDGVVSGRAADERN